MTALLESNSPKSLYRNHCYFHGTNISRIPYVSSIRDFIFMNPYRGKAV